jgi:hypothetical protein
VKDGILVASSKGREAWAAECSESIDRPHVICIDRGFELGKIRWAMENTNWDRIIFIQDSSVITDNGLFDFIAQTPGSICINDSMMIPDAVKHFSAYGGVYERRILEQVGMPPTPTKSRSVLCEAYWNDNYEAWAREHSTMSCLGEIVKREPGFQMHNGRENCVYHTAYFKKYQSEYGQHNGSEMDELHKEWLDDGVTSV